MLLGMTNLQRASALALLLIATTSPAAERPNMVMILADDLGYSDLGCYGGEIETPNLDALAARGVRMRQFYNGSKCEPTRTDLLSGQYHHTVGMGIRRGPTIGHVAQAAGYRAMAVGKWHMQGNPVDRGFDRYFGHLSGAADFFKGNDSFRLDAKPYKIPKDFYATTAFGKRAVRFIDQAHKIGDPFFLYLAFNAPHAPLQAPREDIERYRGKFDAGWDKLREERWRRLQDKGIVDAGWQLPPRPDTIPPWDSLGPEEQKFESLRMAIYAAMVYRMDQEIGRVMRRLDKLGLTDNTLVVFMSDNGASPYCRARHGQLGFGGSMWETGIGWAWLSNTPFRYYKRNMHQGGACTAAIMAGAGVPMPPGTIDDTPRHVTDIMATLVDLSGGAYLSEFEGESFPTPPGRSLLIDPASVDPSNKRTIYSQLFDHRTIISGGYKLVSDHNQPWELYDMTADRTEMNNLAGHSEAAEIEQQLTADFDGWFGDRKLRDAGPEQAYLDVPERLIRKQVLMSP